MTNYWLVSSLLFFIDAVCKKLVLEGGRISYSINQSMTLSLNSTVATYQCNDGLELTSNSSWQRTCTIDGQWSGTESTCGE